MEKNNIHFTVFAIPIYREKQSQIYPEIQLRDCHVVLQLKDSSQ